MCISSVHYTETDWTYRNLLKVVECCSLIAFSSWCKLVHQHDFSGCFSSFFPLVMPLCVRSGPCCLSPVNNPANREGNGWALLVPWSAFLHCYTLGVMRICQLSVLRYHTTASQQEARSKGYRKFCISVEHCVSPLLEEVLGVQLSRSMQAGAHQQALKHGCLSVLL